MFYNRVHRHTYHRVKNLIVYKRKFVNNNTPNGDPNYDNILHRPKRKMRQNSIKKIKNYSIILSNDVNAPEGHYTI
jgi:hypothetical protein